MRTQTSLLPQHDQLVGVESRQTKAVGIDANEAAANQELVHHNLTVDVLQRHAPVGVLLQPPQPAHRVLADHDEPVARNISGSDRPGVCIRLKTQNKNCYSCCRCLQTRIIKTADCN